MLSPPSEVGNVKVQHTSKNVCRLYSNYFQHFLLSQYKRLSLSLQNIHSKNEKNGNYFASIKPSKV